MELSSESWAKLAKSKSRGLTHMLVMEAINSEKTWDEIEDLLRLILCNANIHTYTSCFMNIQQWEKESLAAYVHWFKTEANCCNFTNDTATIRIFVKKPKEHTEFSSRNLWKRSTNGKGCHYWGRETQCTATTYHNHPSIFNGQHDVKQGWLM